MCERLPGNRCANHVKGDVDRKTLKAATILVSSGASFPAELKGKDKEKYDAAVADLRESQRELQYTPEEITKKSAEARKARKSGDIDTADALDSEVYEAKAMRKRRKDGLALLERTEDYVNRRITGAGRTAFTKEVTDEVQAKIDVAVKGKRSSVLKDEATKEFAAEQQAAGRRTLYRLTRTRKQLDKDYAAAVDADDTTAKDKALSKIEANVLQQARVNAAQDRYAAVVTEINRRNAPPVNYSAYSGGCGGRGC